jgi:FAD:protein FMN transferase
MILAVDPDHHLEGHPKGWLFCIAALLFVAGLGGCGEPRGQIQLSGFSMGTSWHVSVIPAADSPSKAELQRGIAQVLEDVNRSMSTYRENSEISRFNSAAPDTWFDLSAEFYTVLSTALAVGWQSNGAYDVTVGPLVDLWGFGPAGVVAAAPDAALITEQLKHVGQDLLRLEGGEAPRLLKRKQLALDFSSIAKGYAVDRIAQWLSEQGLEHYLVEVGGEMRLAGLSGRGDLWRIAIEQPDSADRAVAQAIRLTDAAVATSGDYRNFFELDGRRYSHSIDPRSGRPVVHDLVSVTVIHPSAMIADAWATALVVLGAQDGMAVALANGLAVYFIQRQGEDFTRAHTPAFGQFLETAEAQNQVEPGGFPGE